MGQIGVKVWIFKKELFKKTEKDLIDEAKTMEKEKAPEAADIAAKEGATAAGTPPADNPQQ
jgi:ribosomal protein S3